MSENPFESAKRKKTYELKDESGTPERTMRDAIKEELGLGKKEKADRMGMLKEELGLGKKEKADRMGMLKEELGIGRKGEVDQGDEPLQAQREAPRFDPELDFSDDPDFDDPDLEPLNLDEVRIAKTGLRTSTKAKVILALIALIAVIIILRLL